MNDPERLTEEQRRYYQDTWGFNPVTDRKPLRYGKNFLLSIVGQIEEETPDEGDLSRDTPVKGNATDYYYEASFDLDADPGLQAVGVIIAARVEVFVDGTFHNYIVFRQGLRLTRVNCVHTIVHGYPATNDTSPISPILNEDLRSTESQPAILPPWEHFAALKSYVGGIAATGLKTILLAAYAAPDQTSLLLPFGFNTLMQEQVVQAIRNLSPQAALAIAQDIIGQLLESKSEEWFLRNFTDLDKIWDIYAMGRSNLDLYLQLERILYSEAFRTSASVSPDTHPDVRKYIENRITERKRPPTLIRGSETPSRSETTTLISPQSPPDPPKRDSELEEVEEISTPLTQIPREPMGVVYKNPIIQLIVRGRSIMFKLSWSYYLKITLLLAIVILSTPIFLPSSGDELSVAALCFIIIIPLLSLRILYLALIRLEINNRGLKYRTIFSRQECAWINVQVIDFGNSTERGRRRFFTIENNKGTLIQFPRWDNLVSDQDPLGWDLRAVIKAVGILKEISIKPK